jgi:hypothetical protein
VSNARTLYLVIAATSYEGSDPVLAFEDADDAEAFAAKCRKHEEKCPRCPALEAPQSEWDAYDAKQKKWNTTHPARPFIGRESYSVSPIRLKPRGKARSV